jgi:DNA-dependent metalloprotease WSS1
MSQIRSRELEPLVDQFQHDAHRPRADEALKALQKIASLVKPIMRQRNWRVGTLCEFYPEEANLLGLNINRNEKICLRLRYPGDERQFLPIEQVTDTMLHELCHYVHGPHDQHFHALWDQLRDEHEALLRKGYTGEGFLSEGKRLGGQRMPLHEAKRRARAAAETRRALTAGSGQKLGGAPVMRGTDIRKVIADAAQRRINIEKGCASGTDKGRQIARDVEVKKQGTTITKAEEDDENERMIMQAYIDLVQEDEAEKYGQGYAPPSESNPSGMRGTVRSPGFEHPLLADQANMEKVIKQAPRTPAIPKNAKLPSKPSNPLIDLTQTQDYRQAPETWTCDICTLVNPIQFLACDACTTERPSKFSDTPSRPTSAGSARRSNHDRETSNALKPRLSVVESIARIKEQEGSRPPKPMGWTCSRCGNWMEQQWWTCANCGNMKDSS